MILARRFRRSTVAIFASLCGVATAIGGLLTWVSAHGTRPTIGMSHSSFSQLLQYTLVNEHPFWKSTGFVMVMLGALIALGGLVGLRIFTIIGALGALAVAGIWIGLVAHHYNGAQLPNSYYANPLRLPWSSLRPGAWLAIGGGFLGLLSAMVPGGWKPLLHPAVRYADAYADPEPGPGLTTST